MNPVLQFAFLFFLTSQVCLGQPGLPLSHALTDSEGAIIRTDTTQKTVSLIFSADEFGEGAVEILDVLKEYKVPASFFLTGNFFRNPQFREVIVRIKREGHYLGPHSDRHLLYNSWERRDSLLVTRREFRRDLRGNLRELKRAGILRRDVPWFLPPYEWYNSTICQWSEKMGLRVVNFTPGTGTNADYTTPDIASYKSSEQLMERLLRFEETHSLGLRGAILLIHPGTHPDRTDKFYDRLGDLIQELKSRGYRMERFGGEGKGQGRDPSLWSGRLRSGNVQRFKAFGFAPAFKSPAGRSISFKGSRVQGFKSERIGDPDRQRQEATSFKTERIVVPDRIVRSVDPDR